MVGSCSTVPRREDPLEEELDLSVLVFVALARIPAFAALRSTAQPTIHQHESCLWGGLFITESKQAQRSDQLAKSSDVHHNFESTLSADNPMKYS